jgi:UDP-galactopyranose mutase
LRALERPGDRRRLAARRRTTAFREGSERSAPHVGARAPDARAIEKYDYLVVGAGFAGSIVAERIAAAGRRVLVIDRRPHVAGNAYDELDAHGIRVHRYGPHIFHTNSARVYDYLSRFTAWRPYEHRVLASAGGTLFPFPINRRTLEMVFGRSLDEPAARALLETLREPREPVRTSEDLVLNSVGRRLYELFFYGYTLKQWGLPPERLAAGVAARIPVRTNDDDRYFTDVYQAMPLEGFTALFERMLDHPGITVRTATDFSEVREHCAYGHLVFTGPIDAYFGYALGRLPYRSLRFEHEHLAQIARFQAVGTVNYPNEHAYTRITEFKYLTGQDAAGTSIVREYPMADGEPYYPIPAPENEATFKAYQRLAQDTPNVTFLGRLAQYRYYNMDQVAGAALAAAASLCPP